MKESIRQFKNNDDLIKELESRNLIFPDSKSKERFKDYLKQYGYFSFVKKLSNPLMYKDIERKFYKEEFTSNNLRYLFDIDRNNSIVIFKYFRSIEFLLNSSILKIIAKKLNKELNCPYIAIMSGEFIDDLFPNIDKKIPLFKKKEKSTYLNLYDDLFKNFNNEDFDCYEAIEKNLNEESDDIKKIINNGWFKKHINDELKRKKRKPKNNWEYLDIFSIFQILSFSQLMRIYDYLSISSQNDVNKEFCNDLKHKNKHAKLSSESFKELINILANLRNILMHNGYLTKFSYKINDEKILKEFKTYFEIDIDSSKNTIRLKEIIQIMEAIINIKGFMLKEINELTQNKLKNRTRDRTDKISQLIFEIIKQESGIEIDIELKQNAIKN